jgi:hypothetical protein
MSVTASAWAWQQTIPTGPKFVLLDLADRHNGKTGKCVARVATIAGRTGQCARSVQRHLGDLLELGLIAIQSRHKRAHRFVLRLPEGAAEPAREEREPQPARPAPQPEPAPIRDTMSRTDPGMATQCHPEPEGRDSTGRKEERATAAPPPPAPTPTVEILVEAKPAEAPEPPRERATRWHDDVTHDPDLLRTIVEAGHDPAEITGEISVWAEAQPEPPVRPWVAFTKRWLALKPRFDCRGSAATARGKRDWRAENADFVAETDRMLHVPEGWTYAGVAP